MVSIKQSSWTGWKQISKIKPVLRNKTDSDARELLNKLHNSVRACKAVFPPYRSPFEHISLKVPNVNIDFDVCVESMQLLTQNQKPNFSFARYDKDSSFHFMW